MGILREVEQRKAEEHNVFGFLVCAVIGLVEGSSSVGYLWEAVGNVVVGDHLVEARNVVDLRIMSFWLCGRLSLRSFIPDACGGALRKSAFYVKIERGQKSLRGKYWPGLEAMICNIALTWSFCSTSL